MQLSSAAAGQPVFSKYLAVTLCEQRPSGNTCVQACKPSLPVALTFMRYLSCSGLFVRLFKPDEKATAVQEFNSLIHKVKKIASYHLMNEMYFSPVPERSFFLLAIWMPRAMLPF